MTIQRTDTAVALSTKDLPLEAVNPLAPLVLLSAVLPDGTDTVVVTFSSDATDDGLALPNYVGTARLYSCDAQAEVQIGVGTQAGDGTVTYDMGRAPLVNEVFEFTAAGVVTTCEPVVVQRFVFNGTAGGAITPIFLTEEDEGAFSLQFNLASDSGGAMSMAGTIATNLRIRSTTLDVLATISSTGGNHATMVAVIGTDHAISLSWPAAGGGDGNVTFDALSEVALSGTATGSQAFIIGDSLGTIPFTGAVWDVKVYSNEAMTTLIHWWKMDEGSGLTFLDSVGIDHITIPGGIGAWA